MCMCSTCDSNCECETCIEDTGIGLSGDNLAHDGEVVDGEAEDEADGEDGSKDLPGGVIHRN